MVLTVSIDGFTMFAMRAFLSLCFWAAFSLVTLRGYFVTPDRLHRSVAQFKEGNLVFTVAVSAV